MVWSLINSPFANIHAAYVTENRSDVKRGVSDPICFTDCFLSSCCFCLFCLPTGRDRAGKQWQRGRVRQCPPPCRPSLVQPGTGSDQCQGRVGAHFLKRAQGGSSSQGFKIHGRGNGRLLELLFSGGGGEVQVSGVSLPFQLEGLIVCLSMCSRSLVVSFYQQRKSTQPPTSADIQQGG